MPNLKTSTGLFQTSDEELAQLSKKKGLPAAPTSPLEAGVVGANPDSAKMAGSVAQVQEAVRQSLEAPEDLETARRTEQPRTAATADEQAKKDQGVDLSKLGTLDARVQQLAEQKLTQGGLAANASLSADPAKLPPGLTPEAQTRATELLAKVGDSTITNAELVELNGLFGRTDAEHMLQPEELKQQFMSAPQAIGNQLAANVANDVTVGDLSPQDLGFTSFDELNSLLGKEPGTVEKMTAAQLSEAFGAKQRAEFADADRWRQILADPTAPANERQEARRILREMGAIGTRQVEEQVDKVADQVDAGNRVEFMGQEMSVQDLLKDETVAQIAKDYFENEAYRDQIKAQHTELANWFDANSELLADATKGIETRQAEFAEIQKHNADVGKFKNTNLLPDTMKVLFPEYGQLSSEKVEPPRLLVEMQKANPEVQAQLGQFLDNLATANPAFAKQLAAKGISDLQRLGALDPARRMEIEQFAREVAAVSSGKAKSDPWGFIADVLPGMDEKKLQSQVAQLAAASKYGVNLGGDASYMQGLFDANKDGKLDDAASIAKRLSANRGRSLDDILSGKTSSTAARTKKSLDSILSGLTKDPSPVRRDLFAATQDGKLDMGEVDNLISQYSQGDNLNDLQKLKDTLPKNSVPWQRVNEALGKKNSDILRASYETAGLTPAFVDSIKPNDLRGIRGAFEALATAQRIAKERGADPRMEAQSRALLAGLQGKLNAYAKRAAEAKVRNSLMTSADKRRYVERESQKMASQLWEEIRGQFA